MMDLEPSVENRHASDVAGYSFFHWFMMAGFVAFYAILLPVNQRWFSNEAVRSLFWWSALFLGMVLLGVVVSAHVLTWSKTTRAERLNRTWILSFVLLMFLGQLFRRHSLWVEWLEVPLELTCGVLACWTLYIGLQEQAERTNLEIREKLRKRAEEARFSRAKTISTA